MENQHQRWVNLVFLCAAVLAASLFFAFFGKFVSLYDLETKVKNIDLVLRAVSFVVGLALFAFLYMNRAASQFMSEVVVELSRVTWPTQKETGSSTIVVIVMVVISGMVLGFFDYLWSKTFQWFL